MTVLMTFYVTTSTGDEEKIINVYDANITDAGALVIRTTSNEVHGYAHGTWSRYLCVEQDQVDS